MSSQRQNKRNGSKQARKDNKQSELVRGCRELGLEVTMTKGGHWKVLTPQGPVFMPATSGDSAHGWKKDRSRLRRFGVAV